MKIPFVSLHLVTLVAYVLLSRLGSFAQVPSPVSGEQVLKNIEDNFTGIKDYTVHLQVSADLERLKVPNMEATMYFKQPDKIHFETDGFALLPREGMAMTLGRLRSKYSVESVKMESLEGNTMILLTLRPRAESLKLQELLLSVDSSRWTIARAVMRLPEARKMIATFSYQRFERWWLPAMLSVTFAAGPSDTSALNLFEQITPTRRPQLPRDGTVVVHYSDYKINTGLGEEIFEDPTGDMKTRH